MQDEKEQILQGFLESVEYRNYVLKHTLSEIGPFNDYDFQLQTLLSVVAMSIDNKDIPESLDKIYEAIMSYKDRFLSINNSVDAINNDDVVDAINNISFDYIIASIEDLYDRTGNLEKGQQATIQLLNNIVDKMNTQQNITVKAFDELGDKLGEKLDKIIENTSPDQPEPTPHSKTPQFETLIVKTSKNGISSDGCWYFDDRYSTLKNAVGKLKLDSSKEIIPAENAIITTSIKYKDGRTGNYQVWNGGFEYNAPYNYKKSKSSAIQKSRTNIKQNKENKQKQPKGGISVWDFRYSISDWKKDQKRIHEEKEQKLRDYYENEHKKCVEAKQKRDAERELLKYESCFITKGLFHVIKDPNKGWICCRK